MTPIAGRFTTRRCRAGSGQPSGSAVCAAAQKGVSARTSLPGSGFLHFRAASTLPFQRRTRQVSFRAKGSLPKEFLSCRTQCWSLLPPHSPPAPSLPSRLWPVVGTVFRRPSGTARRSLICRVIGRLFSRSPAYRLRGTRQTSTGKVQQTSRPSRRLYVRTTNGNGASLLGASSPGAAALSALHFRSGRSCTYDFHQTPPHGPRAVRPTRARTRRAWLSRSTPLSLRCRVPSVRAPGLDFHLLSVDHAVRNPSSLTGIDARVHVPVPLRDASTGPRHR